MSRSIREVSATTSKDLTVHSRPSTSVAPPALGALVAVVPVLSTERMELRSFLSTDEPVLQALFSDAVTQAQYPHLPLDAGELRSQIKRWIARPLWSGCGRVALVDKTEGSFVGAARLSVRNVRPKRELEVSYAVMPGARRMGYASEAVAVLKEHAFTSMKADRLVAVIRPGNIPSARVVEKNGLAYVRLVTTREATWALYATRDL